MLVSTSPRNERRLDASPRRLTALRFSISLFALLFFSGTLLAQSTVPNSAPHAVPIIDPIPVAVDRPFPGTLRLEVDATAVSRGITRVTERIPIPKTGQLFLLYPKWLPGEHRPAGTIDRLVGLEITARGQKISWVRDSVDPFAFRIEPPSEASEIVVSFQFLSGPTSAEAVHMVRWSSLVLYPAGYFVRQIPIQASLLLPSGWSAATALTAQTASPAIDYDPVSFDTLIDSPVMVGRYARAIELVPSVALDVMSDQQKDLGLSREQIDQIRDLVVQADRVFDRRHFDHYNFLVSLSARNGGGGLEHHRSSEDYLGANYFADFSADLDSHFVLPHEYVHSWNGKFRRPAGLWTPDFRTPMQNDLLWLYEGQTSFWTSVLAVRSGMLTHDELLGQLASIAATYSEGQPGSIWRSLQDTTAQPLIQRNTDVWPSWARNFDYYLEGALLWLDVDGVIRERTNGRRSLDDFARNFFGLRKGDWGEVTYDFNDVVDALNAVCPYDWKTFLRASLDRTDGSAPLDWIKRGGYRLTWHDQPNPYDANVDKVNEIFDLTYSLGLTVSSTHKIVSILWDGPAFKAGVTTGATVVSVGNKPYTEDVIRDAIQAASTNHQPILIHVRDEAGEHDISVSWTEGLRYPWLEKVTPGRAPLDVLLEPLPGHPLP